MNDLRCTGCGYGWRALPDFVKDGGHVRGLGLALIAECPICGERFGCNAAWAGSGVNRSVEDGETSRSNRPDYY